LFIIKQEGNSFAFVPKGCSQGVLWTFGIAAKNYGRKMLIKVLSLELWVTNIAWWREIDLNNNFYRFVRNRWLVTLVPQHCGKLSIPVPMLRERLKIFLYSLLIWRKEHYQQGKLVLPVF